MIGAASTMRVSSILELHWGAYSIGVSTTTKSTGASSTGASTMEFPQSRGCFNNWRRFDYWGNLDG
jgi:hypothetical protein